LNVGLFSALVGTRPGAETGTQQRQPVAEGMEFVNALLQALRMSPSAGGSGAETADGQAKLATHLDTLYEELEAGGAKDVSTASGSGAGVKGAVAFRATPVEGSSPTRPDSAVAETPTLGESRDHEDRVAPEEFVRATQDASVRSLQGVQEAQGVQEVQEVQERPQEVSVADPSLERVAPALRDRLERVVERMREEFGHDVRVVEGYRSPERQAHLYQQGRSRPGDIATWTRRSWHTDGLAADLQVDGSYDDRLAYARLQRVAR
jgi:hypothetical protein